MAAITYTLLNNAPATATIKSIVFTDEPDIDHVANLSNFGGYLASETAFSDSNTIPKVSTAYTSHNGPVSKTYVNHLTTSGNFYLVLNNTTNVSVGWSALDNGYSGQTVQAVTSATWVQMSAAPGGSPSIGGTISFNSSTISLVVANTTGISAGWIASGNGYSSNQSVVTVVNGTDLTMSAHPDSTPVGGVDILFQSPDPITTMAPSSSLTFTINYTATTAVVGTYTNLVAINAAYATDITREIKNYVILYAGVVIPPPPNDYGGGGDASPPGDQPGPVSPGDTGCPPGSTGVPGCPPGAAAAAAADAAASPAADSGAVDGVDGVDGGDGGDVGDVGDGF